MAPLICLFILVCLLWLVRIGLREGMRRRDAVLPDPEPQTERTCFKFPN